MFNLYSKWGNKKKGQAANNFFFCYSNLKRDLNFPNNPFSSDIFMETCQLVMDTYCQNITSEKILDERTGFYMTKHAAELVEALEDFDRGKSATKAFTQTIVKYNLNKDLALMLLDAIFEDKKGRKKISLDEFWTKKSKKRRKCV